MGLFLGASVFTVLEFVDFFVRIIFANVTRISKKQVRQLKVINCDG